MTMMPRRLLQTILLTTAVAVVAVSSLDAQRGRGGGPGSAGPATVEFIATTADGQPVTDLTAAQLTLRVGNRERAVSSLELVQFGASAASALPAPFGTNSIADAGRSIMIVVDEESLRPGLENIVRDALLEFEKGLTGADRLALFTIPRGTISVPPTTDREAFRSALAKVQGRARNTMTASERRCHTRDTLSALESLLTAGGQPGGGLTPVLFFSTGLVGAGGTAAMESPTDCIIQPSNFQRMGPAADQANAQFYLIRAEENRDRSQLEGLENLAGVTGGQMLFLGAADGGAMTRIARETSFHYIATFQADANERTGASARVDLQSTRADVRLHNRSSVAIARGATGNATPQSMLRELTVHRGFGLRVVGIPSRNDGDPKNDMKVFALAETVDPSVKLTAAAAALYDPLGKLISQWTARPEELQRRVLAAAIPAPAGTYRLRMAAVDASGRAATADYELVVGTASAGPARLGGLMIGVAGAGGFEPVLTITDQQEIIAVFELYGRPEGPFGAIVEILPNLESPAITNAQPQASATQIQDKFMFMARLPVGNLKPGDYVLRTQLAFEGQPTGTLTKTIRKQ